MPGNPLVSHDRGGKDKQREPPHQDGIDKMDYQVYKMPVPDIKLAEMIINGKGEESHRTVWTGIPDGAYIREIVDLWIIDDLVKIIKLERTIKRVGIYDGPQEEYDCQSNKV
jgi:hypothetical protein